MRESETYTSGGRVHSHFDPARKEKEHIGRNAAIRLFRDLYKCKVTDNDVSDSGGRRYTTPDLLATFPDGTELPVEAAGKTWEDWRYIKSGVDVECRKLKYTKHGWMQICMAKAFFDEPDLPPPELLLIPGICLQAADESCGKTYLGHGNIKDHPDFVMPDHGCHVVKKMCKTKSGWEENDFFRVPYKYVTHITYNKDKDVYKLHKRAEKLKWPK